MDVAIENLAWEKLTYAEKNHQLFLMHAKGVTARLDTVFQ